MPTPNQEKYLLTMVENKRIKLFRFWRFLLPFFFVFFLIHFLKDITQDILRIATPLDIFGDAKEDLSSFSPFFQRMFYLFGVSSFIGELFLLISIPTVLKRKTFSRLEVAVLIVVILILLFFLWAILLDPRFTPNFCRPDLIFLKSPFFGLCYNLPGEISMPSREAGETELPRMVCVPRSLGQFLGIELYVARRTLQKFERASRLTEARDLGPLEEADIAIRQAVIEATQEHIKKCEEALENLRQGEKSLAYDLLDERIKGLTNKAIRTLFKGELVGSSKVWQQIESLRRLKEK